MYLTQFTFNRSRRGSQRLLANPQALHAQVMSSFAPEKSEPTDSGRVLWRVDAGIHRTDLYIVSPERPDLTSFVEEAGWPSTESWRTREYAPRIASIRVGQLWQFRLTANPTYYKSIHENKKPQRVAHVTARQQLDWLEAKALAHGFSVGRQTEDPNSMVCAQVTERKDLFFSKNESSTQKRSKRQVSIRTAQFEGILRVTDATAFQKALSFGIGPSKGYGCGLLTIAPVTESSD